ncbi:MAG: DUF1028 domain-containing protein [Alphaproteobacteria bacterium]|jgi:uncharacterized Ntn-hydrolase superfamily protein|nr:DUF1028 domain-containing protein [Alphaproteobacteria bacterium]
MALKVNTFSIAGRCAQTGQLGVAVATKVPAVGAICPFVEWGVGALSTQAWTDPYLGPRVLDRLRDGLAAPDALAAALAASLDPEMRQIGVVDETGASAAHTGAITDPWTGHRCGPDYSCQGNMLAGPEVVEGMADTFEATAGQPLADRLMKALEAGQNAGGDRRGRQSAALIVRGPEVYAAVDLRVDEHPDPVLELRRVLEVARRELFPFVEALPTRENPRGRFDAVRKRLTPR